MSPKGSKMDIYFYMLVSIMMSSLVMRNEVHAQYKISFSVMDFGAVGDGITDDSQALAKAWYATCVAKAHLVVLRLPLGKVFMVKPMKFQGPCNSASIIIQVRGKIIAPNSLSDYPTPTPNSWLDFSHIDGLTVNKGGIIDGRGQVWWNTCQGRVCPRRPATAAFSNCNNLVLDSLTFLNSSGNHISIIGCNGALITRLKIRAPAYSINTDGIDIAFSSGVLIQQCNIETGDDCVAISNQSHDINITKVYCGPGHGISIGSLGKGGSNDTVERVRVWNCTFKDTQNGARIKTWQGGKGHVRNIIYEDINFVNASNPIFIDQFYCPKPQQCANQTSAVNIWDVSFRRMSGTSYSEKAIVLHCSQSVACTVEIDKANITSSITGINTVTDCFNAHIHNGYSKNVPSLKNCL